MRTPILALCSTLFVSSLGCGGSDPPAKSADDQAPPTAAMAPMSQTASAPAEPPVAAGAATTGREGDPNQSPPAALSTGNGPAPNAAAMGTLTDEQIVGITHIANLGENEQARLAPTRTKDGRVKKLAAMMIKDHTEADAKGTELARKVSLIPSESPTCTSLKSEADSNTASLKTQTGTAFDKAYVDTQVKEHQTVLDTIDQKLSPNAKNPDLKSYLTDVRAAVAMHLQHAKDLQSAMAN
jgi:putative membrane protein